MMWRGVHHHWPHSIHNWFIVSLEKRPKMTWYYSSKNLTSQQSYFLYHINHFFSFSKNISLAIKLFYYFILFLFGEGVIKGYKFNMTTYPLVLSSVYDLLRLTQSLLTSLLTKKAVITTETQACKAWKVGCE